jgi:hypothetical protein
VVAMPERVKITGDLYHRRVTDGAVSVAFPSRWHNAHRQVRPRSRAVELYREHLARNPGLIERARHELAGLDLACWCPLDEPCHADVLLEIANQKEERHDEELGAHAAHAPRGAAGGVQGDVQQRQPDRGIPIPQDDAAVLAWRNR